MSSVSAPVICDYGGFVPHYVMAQYSCVAALFVFIHVLDLYGLIQLLVMRSLCMFHALLDANLYCQLCSIVESIWISLCGIIRTVHSIFCISDAVVLFIFELHCCCCVPVAILQWVLFSDLL